MPSTVFNDAVPATPVTAQWLNEVNNFVFGSSGSGGTVAQSPTAQWFEDSGAKVNRLSDRVLIGGATANSGTHTNIGQDWLTSFQVANGRDHGFVEFSQSAVLTTEHPYSSTAMILGAKTGQRTGVGNCIPLTAIGVNDCTAYATNVYGVYAEAFNMAGALGAAFGMEIDTVNYQGQATISPYAQHYKEVVALQLAAGAELPSTGQSPSSAAINIRDNGSTFERGIVFGSSAITGASGTSGTGVAIAFGLGHKMQWYGSDTAPTSSIYSTIPEANAANAISVQFASNGMRLEMPGGQVVANFIPISTAANYLQFVPATTGNSVQIQGQGNDANVNISLVPKGSGKVQFGPYTPGAPAATGYISILDQNGNPRKILVA